MWMIEALQVLAAGGGWVGGANSITSRKVCCSLLLLSMYFETMLDSIGNTLSLA
jgi:hypothetical protein